MWPSVRSALALVIACFVVTMSACLPAAQSGQATPAPLASPAAAPVRQQLDPTLVPAAQPARIPLKVGELGSLGAAPAYVAMGKGYFQEQGINVEFVRFQSGTEMIPLLSSGELSVG